MRQEQQNSLWNVLDDSPIGLCVIARRSRDCLRTNRSLLRMFGAGSTDELYGVGWEGTFVNPKDCEQLLRAVDDGSIVNDYEACRKRLDGSEWWALMNSRLGTFDGEEVIFLWHYDISARKQAEMKYVDMAAHLEQLVTERTRELAGQEQLLRSIVENIPISLLVKDSDHRIELANSTYSKWRGIQSEKVIGARTDEIDAGHTPDHAQRILREERSVLTTGVPVSRESERVLSDGRVHVLKVTKFPIYDENGKVTRVGSFAIDLTQQVMASRAVREQEERFRDFALSSSDWFWETDRRHRFTFFSERMSQITGLDTAQSLGRTRWEAFGTGPESEDWADHIATVEAHSPFRDFRFETRCGNGEPMYVSISGKPVFDEEGEFCGYRGTGSDVTHQRLVEDARDAALRDAERANQAKSEFLATMSHELRTPLNAIIGFSEVLHHQYFGPLGVLRYQEYATDIHDSAVHLLELVNDILDLSTIEKGGAQLNKQPLEVDGLVNECARIVGDKIRLKKINFEIMVPSDLPLIPADQRALKQILLNLLSNAVKFTPDGGSISLQAGLFGNSIEIEIADTGEGIAKERLANITNPFISANPDPYKAGKGWGLGLAISNSLIALHDGEMRIASELGHGTSVTVSLPVGLSQEG